MKSFSKWAIDEVEEEFNLSQNLDDVRLASWMAVNTTPSDAEKRLLDQLQAKLTRSIYAWNEQELIAYFIAPLLAMVDFDKVAYRSFFERELSAPYKKETLSGEVDFVVAQGKYRPKHPFFFIHEYKKERDSSNDPLGQLMVTMVAAQMLNQDENPMYGAYVRGRMWHFVLLDGQEYVVHPGFNAMKAEITDIFSTLKNTKTIIDSLVDAL